MRNLDTFIAITLLASIALFSACSGQAITIAASTSTPIATATVTLTSTPVPTPVPTSTLTPTPTPSSTPTSTSTPLPTPTSTSTLTPTRIVPTSLPTVEPIPNRQTFSSSKLGFAIAYPGDWQPNEKDITVSIANQELKNTNRAKGAELIVGSSPWTDPALNLQARWNAIQADSPGVSFGQPVPIMLGGEEALRAVFSDSRDHSHGWFTIAKHNGRLYIVIAQAFPDNNWVNYENTFQAMLKTFRFLN